MTLSDFFQIAAIALLPVGFGFVFYAIFGLILGLGAALIVLAPELWMVGRELDLRQGGDSR